MKTIKSSEFGISFKHAPYRIDVVADGGFKGNLYLSENDGLSLTVLAPAFKSLLPEGAKWESNGREDVWISHWNDDALCEFDGKYAIVRVTETFSEPDEDGEVEYESTEVELIKTNIQ
jgi:hypothetical protein